MSNVIGFPNEDSLRRLGVNVEMGWRFRPLQSYVKYAPSLIEHASRLLDEEIKTLDDIQVDNECFDRLDIDERFDIETNLLQLQHVAIAIMAFSQFEQMLVSLCARAKHPTQLSLADMSGSGIGKCKTFLSRVCHARRIFSSKQWQDIELIRTVRNSLVHAHGGIETNRVKVKLRNLPGLIIEESNDRHFSYLIPTEEYCKFCIDTFAKVCFGVLEEIQV